jgi:predicted permease
MAVLGAVLPVYCVMAIGALLRRLDLLTEEADRSLLRVTINALMPCLILDWTLGNSALHRLGNVLTAPLVGLATVVLGISLAWACRRMAGLQGEREQRTFAVGVGLYNYGYVPIPLAMMLYDRETVGVLFVHNVGVEAALWTIGLVLLTGGSPGKEWRRIFNLPLLAIGLGLTLNALDWERQIPGFVLTTVKMLGQCAIPLAVVLIGATIMDHLHEFHARPAWRVIGSACLLRLGLLPVLFLLLARYLPCSLELKRVIVLQAAMPAAVFPILMAKHYGGDPATALRVVLSTSLASIVTTPGWIRLGTKWVGL